EDGIRDFHVTGVQTCALPISHERGDSDMAMRNDVDGFGGEAGAEADVTGVPALPRAEGPADSVVQVAQAEGAAPATIVVAIDARSEERRVGRQGRPLQADDSG